MTELDHPNAVRGAYSKLRVMRSAAGYYVGTMWQEFDSLGCTVMECPGSRESEYFETEQEANEMLRFYKEGEE